MTGGMACVLFTDLVGSTELMARLGDAAFDALRDEHFARLRAAVEAHHGALVKTTGDGVLATFGSAVDALAASVAVQQATDAHARAAAIPLELRAGLALGEVADQEGDVFGTPVVEAARLVAAARPGQILCSAMVSMVAGSRATVELTDLGTMELKGLPAPLAVQEVAWAPAPGAGTAVPIPSLLTYRGRVFVCRDRELERLQGLWKETVAGERRVALLGGEPGIGKTRLAAELAEEVHGGGAMVLAGRCDEDLGVPYQPFVEALHHYLAHAARPRLGRHGGELARLVPDLAAVAPGLPAPLRSDPETERYRLFDALTSWLADVSAETPVLLILDDLQWAAKPTLLLLRHVVRSAEPARLLVVATYRDTDIGRDHPLTELLADFRRDRRAERLPLIGLDAPGVAAFLEAAAGHGLDEEAEDLARAVWAETEGNPFFVAEVLRHLSESGALERREGRWGIATATLEELGIPEGVREVVGRRLSRLSETTNRALTVAAVVGLEFEPSVVSAAGSMGEDDVLAALEEAVAARLVVEVRGPVPRSRFSHALVRATLYEELTAGRRVALHRKVAEAIEAVYANRLENHLPALAHHWSRASAPAADVGKAVDYATRAGDQALAQLAHDEAAAYYAQTLELLDAARSATDGPRRLELLISLGEAQRRAGISTYRETFLAAAHRAAEQGDTGALTRAALANTRGWLFSAIGTVDQERVATLESALTALDRADSSVRARLLASLALELYWAGDHPKRVHLSDEALGIARRMGDPATLSAVLSARSVAIMAPGTLVERLSNTTELLDAADQLGDPAVSSMAWAVRARTLTETGDMDGAQQAVLEAVEWAGEAGQPGLRFGPAWIGAGIAVFAGRREEAERLISAIREVGQQSGQPDAHLYAAFAEFQLRFEEGRLAEVEEPIAKLFDVLPGLVVARAMFTLLHCELGREDRAREMLEALTATGLRDLPLDSTWLRSVTNCAVVAAHLGDRRRAGILHELIAPYADQFVTAGGSLSGSVSHYLGLLTTTLGDFGEADARFAAAEAAHARAGAPGWLARTRMEWARMLTRRRVGGDAERARELLDEALATAVDLGLAGVERQARALLVEVTR